MNSNFSGNTIGPTRPEFLYIKVSESDHDKMVEKVLKKCIFNNDINV